MMLFFKYTPSNVTLKKCVIMVSKIVVAFAMATFCTHIFADGYDTPLPSEAKKWIDILMSVGGVIFMVGLIMEAYSLIAHQRVNKAGFWALGIGAVILLCAGWIAMKVGFKVPG